MLFLLGYCYIQRKNTAFIVLLQLNSPLFLFPLSAESVLYAGCVSVCVVLEQASSLYRASDLFLHRRFGVIWAQGPPQFFVVFKHAVVFIGGGGGF